MNFDALVTQILSPVPLVVIGIASLLLNVYVIVSSKITKTRDASKQLAAGVSLWAERKSIVFNVGSSYSIHNIALFGKASFSDRFWEPFTHQSEGTSEPLMWVPGFGKSIRKDNYSRLARFSHIPPGMWKAGLVVGDDNKPQPTVLKMLFTDGQGRSWELSGGKLKRKFFRKNSPNRFPLLFSAIIRRTNEELLRTGFN